MATSGIIRVTVASPRDPESGGPALTIGREYEAKISSDGTHARVTDDEGFPVLLFPGTFEALTEEGLLGMEEGQ